MLAGDKPALRVPASAELWPEDKPIRAAVSSMGFGGINAHIIVDSADGARRTSLTQGHQASRRARARTPSCSWSTRSASPSCAAGSRRWPRCAAGCPTPSSATWPRRWRRARRPPAARGGGRLVPGGGRARVRQAADPAGQPARGRCWTSTTACSSAAPATLPRIAFLFPGQGAGRRGDGGALRRRFESVDELYRNSGLPTDGDLVATEVAQPRIVTGSVAGLRVLADLGIEAVGAAGHSLGELTALHWAGAMDETTLLDAATARGRIMANASAGDGAMASLSAPPEAVEQLLAGEPVVIAGYNSPQQTVVSGPAAAVDRVSAKASAKGLDVSRVHVSHAFHSEAVAPAAEEFQAWLAAREFSTLTNRMVSTVTGDAATGDVDVPSLLARQIREPVRFSDAVTALAAEADLLIEVGPGRILRGLAAQVAPSVPVVSLETDSPSLAGLLRTVAAAYVLGAPVEHDALFADRFTRPLPLDKEFRFFASPCEAAPQDDFAVVGGRGGVAVRAERPRSPAWISS